MDDVGEELHSILIDSGADASIFPLSLLDRGYVVPGGVGKLMDAQGSEIPVESVRDMRSWANAQQAFTEEGKSGGGVGPRSIRRISSLCCLLGLTAWALLISSSR